MDLYTVFFGNTPEMFFFSCIGYIGSVLVIVSMMMSKMIKLRLINTLGCIFTSIFCILTLNMPVLILNGSLILINVFHMTRYFSTKRLYEIIDVDVTGHTLKHFVNKYRKQIMLENPLFFNRYPDSNYAKVIFCDDTVIGMITGRKVDDKLDLFLTYLDPNFRNKDVVRLLNAELQSDGITEKWLKIIPNKYLNYYLKYGWTKEEDKYVYKF